jgi:23S rRNA (guanosine2251-2'-O)-methyltransferase
MQAEGRNPVTELLKSNYKTTLVYMQDALLQDEKITTIIRLAKKKNTPVKYVSKKELDKITKTESHQGVIAQAASFEHKLKDIIDVNKPGRKKLIYIKDANHDHNIGAIIRSAECAGFDGVLLPKKLEITPNIIRASMGACFHIPVLRQSVFQTIKILNGEGFQIIAIELHEKAKNLYATDLKGDILLIIGSEDKGVSQEILAKCDKIIKIPIEGKLNSLNMSVAAAITIFETTRQQSVSDNY